MERGNVGSLSTSQFIAIFTLIAGILLVAGTQIRAKKGVKAFMVGPDGTAWLEENAADEKEEETEDNSEEVSEAGKAAEEDGGAGTAEREDGNGGSEPAAGEKEE